MKYSLKRIGDEVFVTLRGDVTEDSEGTLNELKAKIEVARVYIDGEKVDLINSVGVRVLTAFANALRKSKISFCYSVASVALVEAFNLFIGLCNPDEVEKIAVPIHCSYCDRDGYQIYPASEVLGWSDAGITVACPHCSKGAGVTTDLDSYTYFLKG